MSAAAVTAKEECYKDRIIDALDTLRRRDLSEKLPFKARAYATVIAQLRALVGPIRSMEDLRAVKGMGDAITKKIQEVFDTGHLAVAEVAEEKYQLSLRDALQNIYGVGPVVAKKLIAEHGVTSIADLRAKSAANPELLTRNQQIGLEHYEDLLERIPRAEMDEHRAILVAAFSMTSIDLVGSYRRQAPTSGDIDVLIRMPAELASQSTKKQAQFLAEQVTVLRSSGYLTHVLALGSHKCMAICRLPGGRARRLDLLLTPPQEYAYALLYFTGSDRFNVAFRQLAMTKGYTMNEHTMQPTSSNTMPPPPMATEHSLFAFFGLQYVEPLNRIDGTQLVPAVTVTVSVVAKRPPLQKKSVHLSNPSNGV